ncbi:MAG TPA: Ig-like domain-containing protein [Verrucomicrobiae bacterium]|nr:Ig-like domain-containing protein [Verrucomicrobiae bacterium]
MNSIIYQLTWPCAVALAIGASAPIAQAAAPATPQGLITAKAFTGIAGTAVANLTGSSNFPANPDALMFPAYFEWNATGDISTPPGNWADNYGTQIIGYFYPPATGDYIFYLASDDNSALYLSTDATVANRKLIAQETVWSNPREYLSSGGGSVLTSKDSSTFTGTQWPTTNASGGAQITLQANQPYYIEALSKEGGGGDNLSVAVQDPNLTIDSTAPIPGQYLSSDRTAGPLTIVAQPQGQSVDERGSVTFRVMADGTPPYTYQWRNGTTDIPDATNLNYTIPSVAVTDNNSRFSVVVSGAQGTATSTEAVLTVIPDTVPPALLGAKGQANLTEVVLTFSEAITQASATTAANYQINSTGGSLAVTAAALSPGGTVVTLTTPQQTLGVKYTVTVQNIQDTAAAPNTIAPNSRAVFFAKGKLIEQNGFVVFEVENYDRNLDGLWVPDTTRGTPSGGVSMVNPNGAGGSEFATQLEYDVEFAQVATYRVWYRASADNGNDDSSWFHLDGVRPAERDPANGALANSASMSGFQPQADFVWRSDSQDGPDPFTVDIPSVGPHIVGLARREDGAFFDKFILTTDTAFAPTGFGPPETRQGAPAAPTITLTAPTNGQTFSAGANIALTATATGDLGLAIVRVEFTANGNLVGTATNSPFSFTWNSVPDGIYAIRATATDEIGGSTTSASVVINVGAPPPQALLVVGTASDPVLNASDAGVKSRLESNGWQVAAVQAPASTTSSADGKQLIIVSSTINSGDVADKFRNSPVPALIWEQAVEDNFLMTLDTAADHATLAGQTQVNIVKADHPLAGGLSIGVTTTTTNAQDYSWGVPNTNAVIIATIADNPAQAVIYGYDKDAILIDGATPAPARRVLFFSGNDGFAAYTPDALKLFDAAVEWASGIRVQKPTSARIAWISFHSASNAPSGAAVTAGFTNAPDVAYTDLLTANGHQVTRIVSSGTPDAPLLNAFDLIVISRSVGSGDYQDPPETAAWNGMTAPTMILGGYLLRNNRLGFTTGATIPDTDGPIRLTASVPSHPIFAGIPFDAGNTMSNIFATSGTNGTIRGPNGVAQRGISVNTDALAGGGTILATVAAGDPNAAGGMIIGEWQAGAIMGNGAADVLAGHRLVFLTGTREQGITSEGAGIYDLSADGALLFLNAVNYMAGTEPGTPRPTLSLARTQTGVSITFTGTLESAPSVTGAWTNVPNATSPLNVTPAGLQQYYRAKQ